MPIPDTQTLILPLLKYLGDGKERSSTDLFNALADSFSLTDKERSEETASGTQKAFASRIAWAKANLKMAGMVDSPKRAVTQITDRGKEILGTNPSVINWKFLRTIPGYVEGWNRNKDIETKAEATANTDLLEELTANIGGIPINIGKQDLLKAIEKIDKEGLAKNGESSFYDLEYRDKKYPPKLVVSYANIFRNGKELDRNSFEGGVNTECFKLLDQFDFEIVKKDTGESIFWESLTSFLAQAQTDNLKTSSFLKQYKGLNVKVSFGQGVKANVPWIVLLSPGQTVQDGVYPNFLYFREKNLLTLNYGISETVIPKNSWTIPEGTLTVEEYFKKQFDSEPFRYEDSYIFRVYNVSPETRQLSADSKQVIKDLNGLITQYKMLDFTEQPSEVHSKIESYQTKSPYKYSLNTILYGPPGTGKTFNAINHALAIAKGHDLDTLEQAQINPAERKKRKEEFDELVALGQIAVVTFHQSYGYEEFVEGIKPVVRLDESITYQIVDGIFKKICQRAGDKRFAKNFDIVYEEYITQILAADEYVLKTPGQSKPFVVKISSKQTCIAIPKTEAATELNIQKRFIKTFLETGEAEYYKPYISAIANDIKTKYQSDFKTVDNRHNNFVLIIDEINRGNISKIFGELITLIEDSKRIGAQEELRVKLAYSGGDNGEPFGVPQNLYILGTMNSADKSIALIDTALRRRFTFVAYGPNSELLSTNMSGIDLRRLLETMNERIEFLLSKDHVLGHAYIIGLSTPRELARAFKNKILPLLEEYFYGDQRKIQLVLGDNNGFGKDEEFKILTKRRAFNQDLTFGEEIDGFEEKVLYELNPLLDSVEPPIKLFTSIYLSKS